MQTNLTYSEGTHTYHWDGIRVPSVTQVLNEWIKVGNDYVNSYTGQTVPAWAFKAGGEFGTAFHKAAFLITTGKNITYPEVMNHSVSELRRWLVKEDIKPIGSELRVYSQKLNMAGTLDLAFHMKGHKDLCIVDFKTSKEFKLVGPQVAGYEEGYRYINSYKKKIRRYVLYIPRKEGEIYKFDELTDRTDINMLKYMNFGYCWYRKEK